MNRYSAHVTIGLLAFVLASCGKNQLEDKKNELAALKKEAIAIQEKIRKLESELSKMDTSKKADERLEVSVLTLKADKFKSYIDVQGRVDAEENVALSSQMPGIITRIHVNTGDAVSKGQVLAETDASAILQQISDLETNLELARQAFQKQQNLWKQNIGTEMQYLQSKTTKESLEKKLSLLHEQVRMSKIISPINGTVDAVNIKIAQMVAPGMNAITVVNLKNLKVKAELAESYSSRIKKGDEVSIFFPDNKDSIVAHINHVASTINNMSRTFAVEIHLPAGSKYQPNMVAKLRINDYQSKNPVIIVPVKYIQKDVGESFVLIEQNGTAVKKVLNIIREYNGMAEIGGGLSEGDKLIVEGYDLINEGDNIKVKL